MIIRQSGETRLEGSHKFVSCRRSAGGSAVNRQLLEKLHELVIRTDLRTASTTFSRSRHPHQIDDSIAGNRRHPSKKSIFAIVSEFPNAPRDFKECVLQHILWIGLLLKLNGHMPFHI